MIDVNISFVGTGHYQEPSPIMPEFYAPLENITATQGRDVQFTCVVNHLGEYRVSSFLMKYSYHKIHPIFWKKKRNAGLENVITILRSKTKRQ